MRYLLIHAADPDLDVKWDDQARAALATWAEDSVRAGVNLAGERLRPSADATTVRVRDGQLLITDGPFAETREEVAGFDLIECASMDEAVHWAGRHPGAGAIEVRPLTADAAPVTLPSPAGGRARYLMLVCSDPTADPNGAGRIRAETGGPVGAAVEPWVADLDARGVRLYGSELEPPDTARTVRVRDGRTLVTDGPFAETREQIGGFDLLECADLDEALEAAGRHPVARLGKLEVRPFWPLELD